MTRRLQMNDPKEYVVLVDDQDQVVGIQLKSEVHGYQTPLHRAFSLFIFNRDRELLLQQRSKSKKTWPLVWSNSCCGHPGAGESYEDAVKRRVMHELGIEIDSIYKVSDYRYCFSKDGIMENEICPIFSGFYDGEVIPNPEEVGAVRWVVWEAWLTEINHQPENYTPWCVEEARILAELQVP